MKPTQSITRRLIFSVLLIESVAAVALILALAFHEHRLQLSAVDATLRGGAASLLGAVQDAEDAADNVMLDTKELHLPKAAVYRVEDETGKDLGSSGIVPEPQFLSGRASTNISVSGKSYRFTVLHGIRTVDPGRANGGVTHRITVLYGEPAGRVWHEVFEAIRYFAFVTVILLALTALVLILVMQRVLLPLNDLATEASNISAANWTFIKPETAMQTRELAPLADALSQAIARLQLSFSQQKRFTHDAAHELKTDVAIVKSSLQLLGMKTRTEEEYRSGLANIVGDFGRLEETLRAMLMLARLEQPALNLSSECHLGEVAEESISLCSSYAEMRGVRLKSVVREDPFVSLERSDAILLCSNLIMNAIQHSASGSVVDISLLLDREGVVQLTVADFGEGITKEDLPFIFEAFYRGDPSRNRKMGGTGLGLAICKAICVRAGGSIEVKSQIGCGTTVIVQMPHAPKGPMQSKAILLR